MAECGAEWAERLAGEAEALGAALCRRAAERDKLRSCAAGLAAAAAAFRAARRLALAALRAALQPRALAWALHLAAPGASPSNSDTGKQEYAPNHKLLHLETGIVKKSVGAVRRGGGG